MDIRERERASELTVNKRPVKKEREEGTDEVSCSETAGVCH